jgi:hypothetical protein
VKEERELKRLVVLSIIVAALPVLLATPAFADPLPPGLPCTPTAHGSGAATCTVNGHQVTLPFFAGPCDQVLDGTAIVGNAVFHVTQNTAGDFWITTTNEGTFVGLPAGFTTGRATQWFGDENNSMNQVVHFISDGQVTDTSGATITFHENGHFSISASGQQSPVSFDNCTVS